METDLPQRACGHFEGCRILISTAPFEFASGLKAPRHAGKKFEELKVDSKVDGAKAEGHRSCGSIHFNFFFRGMLLFYVRISGVLSREPEDLERTKFGKDGNQPLDCQLEF